MLIPFESFHFLQPCRNLPNPPPSTQLQLRDILERVKKEAEHGGFLPLFKGSNVHSGDASKWTFAFNRQQGFKYMRTAKTPKLTRYLVKQDDARVGGSKVSRRAVQQRATKVKNEGSEKLK